MSDVINTALIGKIKRTKADKTNVLELDNTTPYTPTLDYHPSTKKFVNDTVNANLGTASTIVAESIILDSTDYTNIIAGGPAMNGYYLCQYTESGVFASGDIIQRTDPITEVSFTNALAPVTVFVKSIQSPVSKYGQIWKVLDPDAQNNASVNQGVFTGVQQISVGTPQSGQYSIHADTNGRFYFQSKVGLTETLLEISGTKVSSVDPTPTDDWTQGCPIGTLWIKPVAGKMWINVSVGAGTAEWIELGGGGVSLEKNFTYEVDITAGDLVKVSTTPGKVSKITSSLPGTGDTIQTFGTLSKGGTETLHVYSSIVTIRIGDKIVMGYTSNSPLSSYVVVGALSGTDIDWGLPLQVLASGVIRSMCPVGTDNFICAFTNTDTYTTLVACKIDGLSVQKGGALGMNYYYSATVTPFSGDYVCLRWSNVPIGQSSGSHFSAVLSVHQDTLAITQYSSTSNPWGGTLTYPGTKARYLDATRIIWMIPNSAIWVAVAERTGTYVNHGAMANITVSGSEDLDFEVIANKTKGVTVNRNGTVVYIALFTISGAGTATTFASIAGSGVSFSAPDTNSLWIEKISETHIVVFYWTNAGALYSRVINCSVSPPIVLGETALATNYTMSTYKMWQPGTPHLTVADGTLLVPYRLASDASRPYMQVLKVGDSLLTEPAKTIGVAKTTGLANSTGTVTLLGGISAVHTGLTIGADYYVSSTGTLTTTPTSFLFGRALSATELLLNKGLLAAGGVINITSVNQKAIKDEPGNTYVSVDTTGFNNGEVVLATGGQQRLKINTAGLVDVAGALKIGTTAEVASAALVGTHRTLLTANSCKSQVCQQTGASTYAWVDTASNTW